MVWADGSLRATAGYRSTTAGSRTGGLGVGVLAAPLGFVAVDVPADLRGTGTEGTGVGRELGDLAGLGVEAVPVDRERAAELGVAHHGGVADPVDGLDAV